MVTTGFHKRLKYFPRIFQGQFEKKQKKHKENTNENKKTQHFVI